jgi:hypothetical protein
MTDAFGIVANVPQPDDLTIDLDQFEAAEPAQGLPRTPPMFEERVGPTRQIVVDAGMV